MPTQLRFVGGCHEYQRAIAGNDSCGNVGLFIFAPKHLFFVRCVNLHWCSLFVCSAGTKFVKIQEIKILEYNFTSVETDAFRSIFRKYLKKALRFIFTDKLGV